MTFPLKCPKLHVCDLHVGLATCWLPSVTLCSLASEACLLAPKCCKFDITFPPVVHQIYLSTYDWVNMRFFHVSGSEAALQFANSSLPQAWSLFNQR